VLERIEQAIVEGVVPPDVANAWRAVRADISRLLGLDAPSKSLSVKVDAESSPLFLRFKKSIAGLDELRLEEAFKYLSGLPRTKTAQAPDQSWFPKPAPKTLEGQ